MRQKIVKMVLIFFFLSSLQRGMNFKVITVSMPVFEFV
jgi:hypothetical protein